MDKTLPARNVDIGSLRKGPIRHESLPDSVVLRIKIVHSVFEDLMGGSLEETIEDFRRDVHPEQELMLWERMAAAFLEFTAGRDLNHQEREEIFSVLLMVSAGPIPADRLRQFRHLTPEKVQEVAERYRAVVPNTDA